MWCFPFFKSKRKKKSTKKRDSLSEKGSHASSDHRAPSEKYAQRIPVAQAAQYGTLRPTRSPKSPRSHVSSSSKSSRSSKSSKSKSKARPRVRFETPKQTKQKPKPKLRVDVPERRQRNVRELDDNSSTEMLLGPRPVRERSERSERHRNRESTQTLRGRGAKRDPPKKSKRTPPGESKKLPSSRSHKKSSDYVRVPSPSPTHAPRRHRHRHREEAPQQQTSPSTYIETPHQYTQTYTPPTPQQPSVRAHHTGPTTPAAHQPYQYTYSDIAQQPAYQIQYSTHRTIPPLRRSPPSQFLESTANTSLRRTPDGRFAVRAATNQALEDIRRQAFTANATPPPPTMRGGGVPARETPWSWDCVAGGERRGGQRSSRREGERSQRESHGRRR